MTVLIIFAIGAIVRAANPMPVRRFFTPAPVFGIGMMRAVERCTVFFFTAIFFFFFFSFFGGDDFFDLEVVVLARPIPSLALTFIALVTA